MWCILNYDDIHVKSDWFLEDFLIFVAMWRNNNLHSSDYICSSTVFPSLSILFHSDTFLSLKSTWISAKISFLWPFREEQEALSEKRRKDKNNNKETKDGLCPWSPKCGSVGPITCLERAHLWSYLPLDQLHCGLGFWGFFWFLFFFLNEWMSLERVGKGFMGIWTSAFLCGFCRLTWLPLACTARVIWMQTHHVSFTHSSEPCLFHIRGGA